MKRKFSGYWINKRLRVTGCQDFLSSWVMKRLKVLCAGTLDSFVANYDRALQAGPLR